MILKITFSHRQALGFPKHTAWPTSLPTPTPTHTHLLGFHRFQNLLRTSLTTAFPSPTYCPWYKCTFDVTYYSRLRAVFPGIPLEDDRNWTAWLIFEDFLTNYKDSIYTMYQRQPQQNAPHLCRLATSNFLCISISPSEMFSLLLLWPWCWTWNILFFWFLSLLRTITIRFFRSSVCSSSDRVGVIGMEGEGDSTSQYFRKCLALVHFSTPSPSFHLTEDGNQS